MTTINKSDFFSNINLTLTKLINQTNISSVFSKLSQYISTKSSLAILIQGIKNQKEEFELNYKYIITLFFSLNKKLLSQEMLDYLMEEKFHITLMKWLRREKKRIKKAIKKKVDMTCDLNIFSGLLINILSLNELFQIKTNELIEYKLYDKFFKIIKFLKLYLNNSLPFFNSIEQILKNWKTNIECYNLSTAIHSFLLNKKTKRSEFDDKHETEQDSEDNKKRKKVKFDFSRNVIIDYNKNDPPAAKLINAE